MRKSLILSILFLVLLNLSSVHAAQVLFTPVVVAFEQYSDNIFLDYQDPVADFITGAGLDLTGEVLWRTAGLTLNYSPTYNAYLDNDELNYWRQSADLNVYKNFTRNTRLDFRNNYLQTSNPTDTITDTGGEDIPVDVNRRGLNPYQVYNADLSLLHNFGADDSIRLSLAHRIYEEIDPPPSVITNDNNSLMPSLAFVYNFTQRWGFDVDGSYAMRDYTQQSDRTELNGNFRLRRSFNRSIYAYINYRHTALDYEEPEYENYIVYEPTIGFRYTFREAGHIEIGIGYIVQEFENSDGQESPSITADINKRWNYRSGYWGIFGNSGYSIDDGATTDYGLTLFAVGRIEAGYYFTPHLTGTTYASYRHNDYPNDPDEGITGLTRAGLGLEWQALRWMNLGLSYNFRDFNSNVETEEYTENLAQFTIRIGRPTPFRWN